MYGRKQCPKMLDLSLRFCTLLLFLLRAFDLQLILHKLPESEDLLKKGHSCDESESHCEKIKSLYSLGAHAKRLTQRTRTKQGGKSGTKSARAGARKGEMYTLPQS